MNTHQGFPKPIPPQPDGLNLPLLKLPQVERRIYVPDGHTLLSAALEAGIPYPHSCTSGRCGACKSRLVDGSVTLGKHSPFALTDEERAGGLILACRAVPTTDVTVEWLDETVPAAGTATQEATVVAIERMTHDIRLIRLELRNRSSFRFAAGQHLKLKIEGAPARHYSIASRPDQELLELHIRAVPSGSTSTKIVCSLRTGDPVAVKGPAGSAYLRDTHPGPILAIAGGTGLAPVKSVVETALLAGMDVPVHLYFGVRTERDLYMVDHFNEFMKRFHNLTFFPVVSTGTSRNLRTGNVSDAVAQDHESLAGFKAYLAGSPAMIGAAIPVLIARGAPARDIHADVFLTPEEPTSQMEEPL